MHPFGIGCGYAAHPVAYHDNSTLLIVRLSDGVSWFVEGTGAGTPGFRFQFGFGATCDEVFATAETETQAMTIVRIRNDSLGPGTAPD